MGPVRRLGQEGTEDLFAGQHPRVPQIYECVMELNEHIDMRLNWVNRLATNPSYQQNMDGTTEGNAFVLRK